MSEESSIQKKSENSEIDIVEIIKTIWAGRKTVYKSIGIFFFIGIIMAFGTPKEYISEVTLLVECGGCCSTLLFSSIDLLL